MSDDRFDALKKRVSDRLEAASRRLDEKIEGRLASSRPGAGSTPPIVTGRAALQAASELVREDTPPGITGLPGSRFGDDQIPATDRPDAPLGNWRCIVHSKWVNIDLTANIAEEGSLSAQGTLIYEVTYKSFNVSGPGSWTMLPPDEHSPKWLFCFQLKPSNHASFSWFASPTDSPNHLRNRFVNPETGSVVETHCERVG